MPRDIMSSHPSQGTGWYLASWSCLCSAVLRHPPPNLPNTTQHLGSDDMSLGIKSFAIEGVHDKVHHKVHDKVRDKVLDKVQDEAWASSTNIFCGACSAHPGLFLMILLRF